MGWLFLLGIIILVVLLSRQSNSGPPPQNPIDGQLEARNYEWAQFIANYYAVASTKSEKGLIRRMLADISAQGLPVPLLPEGDTADLVMPDRQKHGEGSPAELAERNELQQVTAAGASNQPVAASRASIEQQAATQIQLDNASLLLYFGAFLFVASAGLFVAFGGLPGGLRTFIVLLVALVMYAGGLWLYDNRPKLQQAALTFVGIGMTVMPLTGLAAYNYVFDQANANGVWLSTSILCMAMYAHALVKLHRPLISYIFIFTFLSLFESGISIVNSPIYYFGWGMALVGIGLSIAGRLKGFWPELQEPATYSAAAFVPLAVLTSLVLVTTQGVGQLGVSLLLAAAYYGLQTISTKDDEQLFNAIATQIGLTTGVAALTYAATKSWAGLAVSIALTNVVLLAGVLLQRAGNLLWTNAATIVLAFQFLATFAAMERVGLVLGLTISLVVMAVAVWLHQHRDDAYAVAAIAWMTLPVIYGLWVVKPQLSGQTIAWLLLSALVAQLALNMMRRFSFATDAWRVVALEVYMLSAVVVAVASFWAHAWPAVLINALIASSMVALSVRGNGAIWSSAAGLCIVVPLLRGWDGATGAFLATTLLGLGLNVALSLYHRQELNRWASTALWLLLPVALGNGVMGSQWSQTAYAWAYLAAMVGLVISRAIARGALLPSGQVPLASYARNASLSYVVGYCFAAVSAVGLSLEVPHAQLHATLILGILTMFVTVVGLYVEKRADILVLVPLLIQAVLLSAMRPAEPSTAPIVYLLLSTGIAICTYFGAPQKLHRLAVGEVVQQAALMTLFVAPLARLFTDHTYWPMPFGLLLAGGLVYYHIRQTTQEHRELTGGLITLAIFWFMGFWGVHAVQAYTHVLVAQFALYAYWRHIRGELEQSDQYLMLMLATATVPLALQAIAGQAGGLYGWWLLLEQVVFMLIGMTIGKRFVTMWGLYVAVGAVLYQLRNLGWAALTVLAVFLIGLAIYKLQKITNKE